MPERTPSGGGLTRAALSVHTGSVYGTPAFAPSEGTDAPGTPHSEGAMSVELYPEHSARRAADRSMMGRGADASNGGLSGGWESGGPRGRGGVGGPAAPAEQGAEALRLPDGKLSTVWLSSSMAVDTSFAPWAES